MKNFERAKEKNISNKYDVNTKHVITDAMTDCLKFSVFNVVQRM